MRRSRSRLIGLVIASGRLPALNENRNGAPRWRGSDAMISCAAADSGTRCSRAVASLPFIRDAGMVMVSPSIFGPR